MSHFAFHPELFEKRAEAINALAHHQIEWMSDYSSIDINHDIYGIEVIGIKNRNTAHEIIAVLRPIFPQWSNIQLFLQDDGKCDAGFWVFVTRSAAR